MKKILVMMAAIIVLAFALGTEAFANEYKLDENGVLWGKGNNEHGQLGREPQFEINKYGTKEYIEIKEFVPILDNVKSYLASVAIYAIREDNSLWAWGQNFSAQCGVGHTEDVYKPVKIMDNVKMVKAMTRGALAVDNNGVLYSWGSNESNMGMASSRGVLGLGDTEELTLSPVKVLEDVRSVYAGSGILTAMAIKNNGELWAAGTHLTIPQNEGWYVFTKVEGLENVKNVELDTFNARIDTEEGDVYFWGDVTDWGGIGSFPLRVVKAFNTPQKVMSGIEKAAGNADMFGLKPDGTLWYWGEDTNFVDAKCVMNNIKDISTRQYFLSEDGTLYRYDYMESEKEPVIKAMLTDVDCFLDYNIALRNDGTKWELREHDVVLIEGGFTYENGVLYFSGEGEVSIPKIDLQSDEMKTVHIGKGVTNVDAVISAFSGHTNYINVEEIIVDEGNEHFSSVDGVLFNKDKSVLIKFPPFKEGEYVIPEGVKKLDTRAFARSLRLTEVVIPDGVSEIKEGTFSQCRDLESVTIPQSVKKIEAGAFSGGDTNIVGQHPTALKEINYKGTYAHWLKIEKGASYNYHRMNITAGGDLLERATKNFTDTYILFGGKRIELTAPMHANYDRVMVPLEDICTAMGYSVEWDNTAWGVRAIKGYEQILFPVFPDNTFKGEVYDVYYIDGSGESVVTQNSYQPQSLQGGLYHEDIYHHSVLNNGKAMASIKLLEKVFGSEVIFGTEDIKSKAKFVSRFDEHTIAFYENTIWAWGGEYGEVPVKLLDNVKKPVADGCLTSDKKLYMWGAKAYMGIGESEGKADTPILVMENVEDVWNTAYRYFARKTDGSMWAWGEEGYMTVVKNNGYSMELYIRNQLGIGENEKHDIEYSATRMSIDDVCEMKFYSWTTFAKTDNNDLYAWGDTFDQSGFIDSNIPVKIGENVFDFSNEVMLLNNGDLLNLSGDVLLKNVYHFTTEWSGYNANMAATYTTYAYCQDGNLYKMKNDEAVLEKENTVPEGVEVKPLVIGIYVNGDVLDADTMPYIKNDRTMVPMRAIFEALGATVSWDDATKTAIGTKDRVEIINDNGVEKIHTTQDEVKITIGENVLYKNGEATLLDCAAEITNDRTMVPVRAISEAFGCTVTWNNEMKTVEIIQN